MALDGLDSFEDGRAIIHYAALANATSGEMLGKIKAGESVRLTVVITKSPQIVNPGILVLLNDSNGTTVFKINNYVFKQSLKVSGEQFTVTIEFTFPSINNGKYTFSLAVITRENHQLKYLQWVHDALVVDVFNADNRFKQGGLLVLDDVKISSLSPGFNNSNTNN